MPLFPALELILRARERKYAVGYFESWNVESLQGVLDAAEETRSPVLIGYNGGFLSRRGRLAGERLSWYAALARAAAESASVPCGMMFNECPDDAWVREAVDLGFGLVMPDDPAAGGEAFLRRVAELARYAHAKGAAVEAEVGRLPVGAPGVLAEGTAEPTDPAEAAAFVRATGIDVLAVSVGNVHVMLRGSQDLDVGRVAALAKAVDLPFDLHGGTGISGDSLREAVRNGVAKVSFGTCMKQRYLASIGEVLGTEAANPHERLGFGGAGDLLTAGRRAVKEAVLERIVLLGCSGRA